MIHPLNGVIGADARRVTPPTRPPPAGTAGGGMSIASLIALGVDLVVVVAVAVFVIGRRRWLKRQPGEFAGAIRVPGEVEGLSPEWKRGWGRWVHGIRRENHPRAACRHLRSSW